MVILVSFILHSDLSIHHFDTRIKIMDARVDSVLLIGFCLTVQEIINSYSESVRYQ